MNRNPAWLEVLPVNPIRRIFREGHPGVQIRCLALLADPVDARVRSLQGYLRQAAISSPPVTRILKQQRADGTWPVEASDQPAGMVKQLMLIGLLENLHALAVLGAHRYWPAVSRGLAAMLAYQQEDGRFPLPYHQHACIGYILVDLGLGRNPAVHRAAHWILDRQRDDGGWLHPQMAGQRKHPSSCIWTTAEVLAFITRYPTLRVKEHLQRAGEFLLAKALLPNTTALLPDTHTWDILGVGSKGVQLYQGGTLKVLDGLTLAGFNPSHPTFKKLYTWLLEQQLEGGYFPRIAGRDMEGAPDVTVRALEVIRRVETTRPG